MRLTEELSVMLDITEISKNQRRPAEASRQAVPAPN